MWNQAEQFAIKEMDQYTNHHPINISVYSEFQVEIAHFRICLSLEFKQTLEVRTQISLHSDKLC